ncbi:hypothetical protein SK128_005711, partial [Halocaridina rubra]
KSSVIQENLNFYGSNNNRTWKNSGDSSDYMSSTCREEPIELTLRAYFCHTCGGKIVGKDAYFLHIKEHNSRPSSHAPNGPSSLNSSSQLEVASPVWNDAGPSSPFGASISSTPGNVMTDSETVTSEDTREATASPEAQLSDCMEDIHVANQLLKLREWQLGKHGRRFRRNHLSFTSSPRVSNQSPLSEKQPYSISPSTIIDPGSVDRFQQETDIEFESSDKISDTNEPPSSSQGNINALCFSVETTTTEIPEDSVPQSKNSNIYEMIGTGEEELCNNDMSEVLPHETEALASMFISRKEVDNTSPAEEEDVSLDDCIISPLVTDCFAGSPSIHPPPCNTATSPVPFTVGDRAKSSVFTSDSWISPHQPVQLLELDSVTKYIPETGMLSQNKLESASQATPEAEMSILHQNQSKHNKLPCQDEILSLDEPLVSSSAQVSGECNEEIQLSIPLSQDYITEGVTASRYTSSGFSEIISQKDNTACYKHSDTIKYSNLKQEAREFIVNHNAEREKRKCVNEEICSPENTDVSGDCQNEKTLQKDCNESFTGIYDVSDKARSSGDSCEGHVDGAKPYFHKKFHHDPERKGVSTVGIGQNADVSRYIQSFQSLLVSKLNGTLSTNIPFKDMSLHSTTKKSKKQNANINIESSVTHQSYSNEHVCEVCGMKFTNRPAYKTHCQLHEIEGQKSFRCMYCEKTFFRKRSKDLHMRKHTGEKTHRCEQCSQVFTKMYSYNRHRSEVHAVKKSFVCAECSKGFCSQRQLEDHICVHQSEKLHKCKYCSHSCHTASGIRTHMMEIHSGKQDSGHQCEQCGENFKKNSGLKRHILRKHTVQNLQCDMCPKVYSCNEDLLHHRKTHISEPLQCEQCGKTFTSTWNLQRHAVTHNSTTHPHKCDKCPLTFTRLDSLSCHMKIHAQKKPHICHCGKRFVKKSHLIDHQDKHSQIPNHTCNVCNRAFKFKVSLKNHSCKVNVNASRKENMTSSS